MKGNHSAEAVIEIQRQLINKQIQHWYYDSFLHWEWWLLIILLILPWLIWWKLADKNKMGLIFQFGLLVLTFTAFLDDLGSGLLWWYYPYKLIPTLHVLLPPSISIVPCLMMLVFQHCPTWKKFLIKNFLLSLVLSLIGEPLFMLLGLYELNTWNLFYSFLFYNFAGALARWTVLKMNKTHHLEKGIK